jgi:hypothetical protein
MIAAHAGGVAGGWPVASVDFLGDHRALSEPHQIAPVASRSIVVGSRAG